MFLYYHSHRVHSAMPPAPPPRMSAPAVLALGGSLLSAALFAAGSMASCAGGVGCTYGPADTWLQYLSVFVPLAAVAHLISCVAVAADRSSGKRRWYPRASGMALPLAVAAFTTSVTQWSAARTQLGPALARQTGYGMVLFGQATWLSFLAYLLGDAVPHEHKIPVLPVTEVKRVSAREKKTWKRFGSV